METKNRRSKEIAEQYILFIDKHVKDVIDNHITEFMKLSEIASELAVSHQHLTETIQRELGHHPCYFYDAKIIEKAQYYLEHSELSIARIAQMFTYDPSNFSKFFKNKTGVTPGQFRFMLKK